MSILKYALIFLGSYAIIFLFYFLTSVNPELKKLRKKNNKKSSKKTKKEIKDKKPGTDIQLLKGFYKIDIDKIGLLRTLKILNIVNPFVLSILVVLVFPLKQMWLKFLILILAILPVVWFTYYFVAKYLRHLERKYENE